MSQIMEKFDDLNKLNSRVKILYVFEDYLKCLSKNIIVFHRIIERTRIDRLQIVVLQITINTFSYFKNCKTNKMLILSANSFQNYNLFPIENLFKINFNFTNSVSCSLPTIIPFANSVIIYKIYHNVIPTS